jgi:exosortase E/protease (VPEID-CTERM system)
MFAPFRLGLLPRALVAGVILAIEALVLSYFIQASLTDGSAGIAEAVHYAQQWLFNFVIAYAASCALLMYLSKPGTLASLSAIGTGVPIRWRWLMGHLLLLIPLVWLSLSVYRGAQASLFLPAARAACAFGVAMVLLEAMAPLSLWWRAVRGAGAIPLYAIVPAALAVAAIKSSQLLWAPAAKFTFGIVQWMLRPFYADISGDPNTLTLGTARFVVQVSEACSGLEGVGLMLVFCIGWLWYFRKEYYWPRALLIIPSAVVLIFILNAARIAALVAIGDAGFERIATAGFHSQAGWIAFNLAAFTVALVAKRSAWLNRVASEGAASAPGAARAAHSDNVTQDNPTAAFLMPILAILAAGMIAHALSAGFDVLYALRLVACAAVLVIYRRSYKNLDWKFGWRGVSMGVIIFGVWTLFAHGLNAHAARPDALTHMSAPARTLWILTRAAAAIVTVPIAEELAYRGYLMRRLVNEHFDAVTFSAVPWTALVVTSVVFGITHGSMWLPGIGAGLAYGWLVIKTGRIGEATVAHATTNALLAGYVLLFDQWQLW